MSTEQQTVLPPTTAKRTEYFRQYFSNRYETDPVYRATKQATNRARYVKRTTACDLCGGAITAKSAEIDSSCCRKCRTAPKRPRVTL